MILKFELNLEEHDCQQHLDTFLIKWKIIEVMFRKLPCLALSFWRKLKYLQRIDGISTVLKFVSVG